MAEAMQLNSGPDSVLALLEAALLLLSGVHC